LAGLYIHIPFCKQACHYCNFHFSTSLKYRDEMVTAIIREMGIELIFEAAHRIFKVATDAEITLEANPDDLNKVTLEGLRASPVNRLSIGVQSFHEEDLQFMNRAHNSTEALNCLHEAKAMGFNNMTIDLIYGTPGLTDAKWLGSFCQKRQSGSSG